MHNTLFVIFINLITPNSVIQQANTDRAIECIPCICIFDALRRPYHDTHALSAINRCTRSVYRMCATREGGCNCAQNMHPNQMGSLPYFS